MLNTESRSLTIQCSRCGQIQSMDLGAAYTHTIEQEIEDVGFYLERFVIRLLVCPNCRAVNLAVEDESQQMRVWLVPLSSDREHDDSRSR